MTDPTPRATAAVLHLVTGHGAAKHGDDWKTDSDRESMSHVETHKVHYFDPDWPDREVESGQLHLVHMIAGLNFVLERRLILDEERLQAAKNDSAGGDAEENATVHLGDSTGNPGDG